MSKKNLEKAYFAGGCFWGVEYYFKNLKGVVSTSVGYMGGKTPNPTYDQVCSGKTGHAEVLEVCWDSDELSFETLAKLFFEIHDPTDSGGQGPDRGDQYRSEIFFTNSSQKEVSEKLIEVLKTKGMAVVTKVTEAKVFYKAEEYHQSYYFKNGQTPYCHTRRQLFG